MKCSSIEKFKLDVAQINGKRTTTSCCFFFFLNYTHSVASLLAKLIESNAIHYN